MGKDGSCGHAIVLTQSGCDSDLSLTSDAGMFSHWPYLGAKMILLGFTGFRGEK